MILNVKTGSINVKKLLQDVSFKYDYLLFEPVREKTNNLGSTWSDTNRTVQPQKTARSLKFRIREEEGLYYPCSENKGADQLRSWCEVDLRLCFRLCRLLVFSCTAHFVNFQIVIQCVYCMRYIAILFHFSPFLCVFYILFSN